MNLRPLAYALPLLGALLLPRCDNSGIEGGGGGGAGGAAFCVDTCNAALVSGGVPCSGSGSLDAYQALTSCACGTDGACNEACGANFCSETATDSACNACLQMSCSDATNDCAND